MASIKELHQQYYKDYLLHSNTHFGCLPDHFEPNDRVSIEIISGEKLAAMDLNGKSDPYVLIYLCHDESFAKKEVYRSQVIEKTLDPVWNENFVFYLTKKEKVFPILFVVMDKDTVSKDDLIGYERLVLDNKVPINNKQEITLDLQPKGNGSIKLRIHVERQGLETTTSNKSIVEHYHQLHQQQEDNNNPVLLQPKQSVKDVVVESGNVGNNNELDEKKIDLTELEQQTDLPEINRNPLGGLSSHMLLSSQVSLSAKQIDISSEPITSSTISNVEESKKEEQERENKENENEKHQIVQHFKEMKGIIRQNYGSPFTFHFNFIQQFGKRGDQPNEFKEPHDIKIDQKNSLIYICDNGNCRIQQFDLVSREYKSEITLPSRPLSCCFDTTFENIIYISCEDNFIYKFDKNGTQIDKYGNGKGNGKEELNFPCSLVHDKDSKLYICDSRNDRIQVINTKDGVFLNSLGNGNGIEDEQFNHPKGIDINLDGNLVISENVNRRIKILATDGTLVSKFTPNREDKTRESEIRGLVVDKANGNIIVCDSDQIHVFDKEGNLLSTFSGKRGTSTLFNGVDVDGFGNIYVGEIVGNKVYIFN